MKKDIIIPEAGESVTEADIVSWYKHDGDYVVMDDPIVELETDKASMDLTAEISGIISISIKSGTVQVGQVIGSITESDEKPASKAPAPSQDTIATEVPTPATTNDYAKGHPSPAAAKAMAEKGSGFRKILKHYYTGVQIKAY